MKKDTILTRLITECPFPDVFQDTERIEGDIRDIPRLKIGHIRADYSGRWWNSVWPCYNDTNLKLKTLILKRLELNTINGFLDSLLRKK